MKSPGIGNGGGRNWPSPGGESDSGDDDDAGVLLSISDGTPPGLPNAAIILTWERGLETSFEYPLGTRDSRRDSLQDTDFKEVKRERW